MEILTAANLQRFGLNDKAAALYLALLELGETSVAKLSTATGNKKGNTYNLLDELVLLGIVEQSQTKPRALFRTTDPARFRKLIQEQQLQVQENAMLLENLLPQLVSTYNTTTNAPSVRIYEGLAGMKQVYGEMLKARPKEQLTIVSTRGAMQQDDETRNYIREMRRERARLKIQNRILGPELPNTKKHILGENKALLTDRRITNAKFLQSPAEILIWNNSVALVSTQEPQVMTVIENGPIADTFRNIFEYMWMHAEPEHEAIVKSWK